MNADVCTIIVEFIGRGKYVNQIISKEWLKCYKNKFGPLTSVCEITTPYLLDLFIKTWPYKSDYFANFIKRNTIQNGNEELVDYIRKTFDHNIYSYGVWECKNLKVIKKYLNETVRYNRLMKDFLFEAYKKDNLDLFILMLDNKVKLDKKTFLECVANGSEKIFAFHEKIIKRRNRDLYYNEKTLEAAARGGSLTIFKKIHEKVKNVSGEILTRIKNSVLMYSGSFEFIEYIHINFSPYISLTNTSFISRRLGACLFMDEYFPECTYEPVLVHTNDRPVRLGHFNYSPNNQFCQPEVLKLLLSRGAVFPENICKNVFVLEYITIFVQFGYKHYILERNICEFDKHIFYIKDNIEPRILELVSEKILEGNDQIYYRNDYICLLKDEVKKAFAKNTLFRGEHGIYAQDIKETVYYCGYPEEDDIRHYLITQKNITSCCSRLLIKGIKNLNKQELFVMIDHYYKKPSKFAMLEKKIGFSFYSLELMIRNGKCSIKVLEYILRNYFDNNVNLFVAFTSIFIPENIVIEFCHSATNTLWYE